MAGVPADDALAVVTLDPGLGDVILRRPGSPDHPVLLDVPHVHLLDDPLLLLNGRGV